MCFSHNDVARPIEGRAVRGSNSWETEMQQQQIERPFGVEGLYVMIRVVMPHGWVWDVREWTGGDWAVLDSGTERSWASANRRVVQVLQELEDCSF